MQSLEKLGSWPVPHVSAAVVSPRGTLASTGPTDRVFKLASVTKLLVAYGSLIAIEEGAIGLDEEAGPEGSTVRHLLSHASGLAFGEKRTQAKLATKRIYSSSGFEVLAELIESKTGIAFPEYLRLGVFEPLGMESTALEGPAGHGAVSTVDDLARFAEELLEPRFLAAETLSAATAVQFPDLAGIVPGYGMQRPNEWGLGFEIRGNKAPHWTGSENSPATFGHFGQSGTFLWVDPNVRVATVVLTDRDFGDWAKPLWPELSDDILSEISDL
ncbi:serine hydrolase domain-containing protein [Hoyosella subflava]|uniref:Beta-lactamase n=1 Tax=Hoyosella subflava (strain DSM 45089 / JCM 17490 / NBRC 109087 / DQS3-9A1) TaxID=443218 RepID=F6EEH5_HOYSD|nr:serine hydrolase domain-containing protein [Hoyosella subflava]AEF39672.1 Beta-lactamase [Hoyosella subflava DQS3-9A1]